MLLNGMAAVDPAAQAILLVIIQIVLKGIYQACCYKNRLIELRYKSEYSILHF